MTPAPSNAPETWQRPEFIAALGRVIDAHTNEMQRREKLRKENE